MKAVSGKVLTTIVTVVLALIGLIVLWIFLSKAAPYVTDQIRRVACAMCRSIPVVTYICGC